MNARNERLRQLLREADVAREVPELDANEVARLRRAVLTAADREERSWLARPGVALAFAAVMAAVVVGFALWRFDLAWKSSPRSERAAASSRTQTRSSHDRARPSTTSEGSGP